jgi:hypothetical protein
MQREHFPGLTPFNPSEKLVTWFIVGFFILVSFLLLCFVARLH